MEIVSKLYNAPRRRIDQTFDQLKLYPLAQYNGQVRVFIIYGKLQKKNSLMKIVYSYFCYIGIF